MLKKILIAALVLVVLLAGGLFVWARSVLGQDGVRTAIAGQLSKTLGQPVTIGSIGATIYPRVTVNLGGVSIGQPAKITIQTLHVGANFGALLSRRIEHASMNVSGARIELPLPDFAIAASEPAAPSSAPVEIVSIDEVVFSDVEIVSGGRTLKGSVDVVPAGKGLTVRRISLAADNTSIDITGQIADLAGPSGELTVKAGALNFDQILAFVSDFSGGAGINAQPPREAPPAAAAPGGVPTMNLAIALEADKASMGSLTIDELSGRARIAGDAVTLEPVSFGLFGGRYDGSLALTLGQTPDFRLKARLTGIDMAAATAFAGSPNQITGKLAATLDLAGRGMEAPSVMKSARGTARVDITDGTVKNLGLIQSVVVVTSGRAGAKSSLGGGSKDEPFSRLGGTLNIAGGSASTQDLEFEAKDLVLSAAGAVKLDGTAINLQGQLQLSEELSKQAGSDLVRYTQDQGKVTFPATITGSAQSPQVRIDVGSMAKRAITNRANEEAQKALKKGLGGLFQKK
jgi:uncharacterized protein involved in outer membrane biogenesis